ncbi:hypothetical protein [Haloarchaeobius sp. HRN-SO-5]|uniref:hypothetical protein n=1 Tax=Haloarchaeobius sp. HRN-SO-5 TaxID=3446118 RepID=UPI003EB74B62
MYVREAVEADAPAMAAIADTPVDVMRNLIHDRTVQVAATEDPTIADPNADVEDPEVPELLGFVSFDAATDVVYVTQLDGTADACERLLAAPVGFARTEGMDVELLVTDPSDPAAVAAERVGFEKDGPGPRFDRQQTVRYRYVTGD